MGQSMATELSVQEVSVLNGLVKKLKKNEQLWHDPKIEKFKNYIVKLGGKLPAPVKEKKADDLPDLEEVADPIEEEPKKEQPKTKEPTKEPKKTRTKRRY